MDSKIDNGLAKIELQKEKIRLQEKVIREREKRREFKQLVEIGKLAYKANIHKFDKEILLGAFLTIAEMLNHNKFVNECKEKASRQLNPIESKSETALSVKFIDSPTKKIKDDLKKIGFRWNPIRNEFCGYSSKDRLILLLEGIEAKIEEIS